MRKVLRIEPEVREIARKYLEDQLAIMRKFGSEPVLTPDQYEDILYKCAEPVQAVRNYNARRAGERGKDGG